MQHCGAASPTSPLPHFPVPICEMTWRDGKAADLSCLRSSGEECSIIEGAVAVNGISVSPKHCLLVTVSLLTLCCCIEVTRGAVPLALLSLTPGALAQCSDHSTAKAVGTGEPPHTHLHQLKRTPSLAGCFTSMCMISPSASLILPLALRGE